METTVSINPLEQYCLDNLQKMVDLAMQTAAAASAAGDHKVVLQAVREVTRMVTLITKITNPPAKKAAKAPDSPKIVAGPEAQISAQSNDLVQDVLKFFPGLCNESQIDQPELATQNPNFWKQGKSGKKRHKGSR